MPDAALLKAAKSGQLNQPAQLRSQVERMLKDSRASAFTEHFTGQWLRLRDIAFTEPDKKLFPEYDEALKHGMLEETRRFFDRVLKENRSLLEFVDADWTILNARLASHYGIDGVVGSGFRVVDLPEDSVRGGVLTQASVLKVTANGTNTSPVLRGTWVMERILGKTPTPPPPGIPGVEPDIRGSESLRDLLAKHRSMESCRGCHAKFDPLGFALESFNPIGGFRDHYRSLGNTKYPKVDRFVKGRGVQYRQGPKVDASGNFEDGVKFAGFTEFQSHLARQPENLTRALTKKLLTFATGRELGFSDRAEVERIVKESARNGYRVQDLIHLVVASRIFQSK